MYVNAPHRSTNGLTEVPGSVPYTNRDGYPTPYQSEAEALSHAFDWSGHFPSASSLTQRQDMQSGRIGPGKFLITPYGAEYRSVQHHSAIILIKKSRFGGDHAVETYYPRIGGSGGFNTGVVCHYLDIHPGGGHWQALLNKAVIANLQNRALAEAKNKLNKNDIDAAEALAGLDKTILMVAERTAQVLLAWRQTRRGETGKALKTLGLTRESIKASTPAKAWLELQYGWRPLLTDIYNGMNEANYKLRESDSHVYVKRRLQTGLLTRPITPDFLGGDHFYEDESSHQAHATVEVKFAAKVNSPTLAYLTSLQLTNPLYYAWVSMPFSFVVDWLIPVGDWLSSITAPLGLTFVSGYRTTRVWGDWYYKARKKGIQAPLLFELLKTEGTASASFRLALISREKFFSWPINSLYFRLPSTSIERVLNSVALLGSTSKLR